jgi:hypothetical protein
MPFDLSKLVGKKKVDINLVVGINQVDNLGDWNGKINQPTSETKTEIQSRSKDIVKKLSSGELSVSSEQIEYYSALRAYRLHNLNGKITKYCKDGVIMINSPKEFFESDVATEMPKVVQEAAAKAMAEEDAKIEAQYGINGFLTKIAPYLNKSDIDKIKDLWDNAQARPVRVGVLGKCGVGKSTTVSNLFQGILEESEPIQINVSRIAVGNSVAQYKKYRLPKGGRLTIVDLPGYGRDVTEDATYQKIYIEELKNCDIILLIVQANSTDFADDQIMIQTLIEWKKAKII